MYSNCKNYSIFYLKFVSYTSKLLIIKAVATGTAGTAMAVPLLRPLHLNDFVFNK